MSKEENVAVPSYGRVVNNSEEYVAPPSAPAAEPSAPVPTPAEGQAPIPTEGQAPAAAAPAEGQPKEGTPDYIKDIQSQLAALNSQMANGQGAEGQPGDPLVQLEQQLVELQKQAEDGEITYSEMIRQTAPLIEQRATIKVKQDMMQEREAEQIRGAQDAFLADNPDFMEFAKSPDAQAIRQANPILDNVSAYYAMKAKTAEAAIGGLQSQMDALKAQMESSIKGAAKEQSAVSGAGTGTESQLPVPGKGDGMKPFEGGLAALRRARAAQ